jgi:hypothetical protein
VLECSTVEKLTQALTHLRSAISLLDEAEAPAHIAAQLDLAAHQLMALAVEADGDAFGIGQMDTNADPH